MDDKEKNDIGERIISRIQTGLWFIEDYLTRHPRTDTAGLRSVYILLSFYFELLLKVVYIKTKSFSNKNDLEKQLKNLGHDIKNIGKRIGKIELEKINIKKISRTSGDYLIETDNAKIYVKDLIDIRYDFIEGRVRLIKQDEHDVIKNSIAGIHSILKSVIEIKK